jgi:cell division protein FtsI/penicillin-binding protein 2
MTRRQAILLVLGSSKLDRFVNPAQGCAVVVDARTRRVIASTGSSAAPASPGSTLKPIVLAALLRTGRVSATETYPCPGRLRIGDRQMNCSHPRLDTPMRVHTALAYSCNCFVAHVAERFESGELATELRRFGFANVRPRAAQDAQRLQALGEDGVVVNASELAFAYRLLAKSAPESILSGLEEAVEFGTAQRARVPGVAVAGKTGSAFSAAGEPIAWFAGFLPSRNPEIVVAVMLKGRSGGADAAPVAGEILRSYQAGIAC